MQRFSLNQNGRSIIGRFLLTLAICGFFFYMPFALADGFPESTHPYENSADLTWEYIHPTEAYALKITFSEDTALETNYDYLYVIDADGLEQSFTGTALAGQTVYVKGNGFTLRLTSDGSVTKYGFAVTAVESVTQADYEEFISRPKYTINTSGVLTGYSGQLAELVIPETVDGIAVTGIGSRLFYNNNILTSVTLPSGVTSIDNYAFAGCSNLASVSMGDQITSIGYEAFKNCTSLTSVALPSGLTTIDASAFCGCSNLASVTMGNQITSIGSDAFKNCTSLTSVTLPSGLTIIGSNTFYGCSNLASVSMGSNVTSIASYAFYNCTSLNSISFSSNLTTIGSSAFYGCISLPAITLPSAVTSIQSAAFGRCSSMTSVTMGANVTTIENGAFQNCVLLSNVTLSPGLSSVGSYAFSGCTALARIELPDSIETMGSSCFPSQTILVFGTSDVIESYALQHGNQYICDDRTVIHTGITDPDEKIKWVVANYTRPEMSDYDTALALYHWVLNNVQYDYDYLDDDIPTSDLGVGGEAALIDGWAVCHGYSEAYQWLLQEAGIDAKYVRGYNHAWNIASIDGDWYHFDATWDDTGGGSYDFFALSDMAIHAEPNNHANQYTYRHLVCDSWEANYYYRNGKLDATLESLRSSINQNITDGVYSGTAVASTSPSGRYSEYTVALILNNDSNWDVAGRVEVTPSSSVSRGYDFVFYPDEPLVSAIYINGLDDENTAESYYYMYPGYAAQLNASTMPAGRSITYTSSNESVITVSPTGLVTAVKSGDANITLSAGNCRRSFSIHVNNSSWLLDSSAAYLEPGETKPAPLDDYYHWFLTDTAATWSSSDPSVLSVSNTGVLTGLRQGTATITLTTAAGVSDSIKVYVRQPATALVFENPVAEVYVGQTLRLPLRVEGCDQDFYKNNFSFSYNSSDSSIAEFYGIYSTTWIEEGSYWQYQPAVRGIAPGQVTFTATAWDGSGVSSSCTVMVKDTPKLKALAFTAAEATGMEGNLIQLTLRADPGDGNSDYYEQDLARYDVASSNEDVASHYYTSAGRWVEEAACWEYTVYVRCKTQGEAVLTATGRNLGSASASCTIKVETEPVLQSVCFESDQLELMSGIFPITLYADGGDVYPDYYAENYGNFTYTSSDPSVVEYYSRYHPSWNEEKDCWQYDIFIKCGQPGEAVLTATALDDSGLSASCTIKVSEAPVLQSMVFRTELIEITGTGILMLHLYADGGAENPNYYYDTYGYFSYNSSDPSVAEYYAYSSPRWNGEMACWEYFPWIQVSAPGAITLTASAVDQSGLTAACAIIAHSETPLRLPAMLKNIGEEAFAQSSAVEIVVPEGVHSIGARAFADSPSLRLINLPDSLQTIAADAFEGSTNVVLVCTEGSAGQRFAEANGLMCIVRPAN